MDAIIETSKQKRLKRGGFAEKIFLEKSIKKIKSNNYSEGG